MSKKNGGAPKSKRSFGSIWAKANLPAKAGRRKLPAAKSGLHITTATERRVGRYLGERGLSTTILRRPRNDLKARVRQSFLDHWGQHWQGASA